MLYCQQGRFAEGTRIGCTLIQEKGKRKRKKKRKKKRLSQITFAPLHDGEIYPPESFSETSIPPKSDVVFLNGLSWRKFIFSLPRERACDMIDWTWTQHLDQGEDTPEYVADDHPSVNGDCSIKEM